MRDVRERSPVNQGQIFLLQWRVHIENAFAFHEEIRVWTNVCTRLGAKASRSNAASAPSACKSHVLDEHFFIYVNMQR